MYKLTPRLERLGLEAKDYAYTTVKNYKDNPDQFEQVYLAKFASLVLANCLDAVKQVSQSDELLFLSQNAIKKHFNIDNDDK